MKWRWLGISFALLLFIPLSWGTYKSLHVISPQDLGVKVLLGQVDGQVLKPGFHVLNPFSQVILFPKQKQKLHFENKVLSRQGLPVTLILDLYYHFDAVKLPGLYTDMGKDIAGILIQPILQDLVRQQVSKWKAVDLYKNGQERALFLEQCQKALSQELALRGIRVDELLVLTVKLSKKLEAAIQEKERIQVKMENAELQLKKMEIQRKLEHERALKLEKKD